MTAIATSPTTINIFLFIVSFLLTILIAMSAYIASGFNKRIDATNNRFEIIFETFNKYRSLETCELIREMETKEIEKVKGDLNGLGRKVETNRKFNRQ